MCEAANLVDSGLWRDRVVRWGLERRSGGERQEKARTNAVVLVLGVQVDRLEKERVKFWFLRCVVLLWQPI